VREIRRFILDLLLMNSDLFQPIQTVEHRDACIMIHDPHMEVKRNILKSAEKSESVKKKETSG
jgi:hypothetical protein